MNPELPRKEFPVNLPLIPLRPIAQDDLSAMEIVEPIIIYILEMIAPQIVLYAINNTVPVTEAITEPCLESLRHIVDIVIEQ